MYTVSQKKLGHFFTAYNIRNIEQIFASCQKHGRNYRMAQSLPIHHFYHLFIYG